MKRIKIRIVPFTLMILFLGFSYANGTESLSECQKSVDSLNTLFQFLSWSWMLFAMIAGKLMTNDFVMGGVLHLDSFLWKIHTVMRNFANFALGFFLLWIILKNLFSESDVASELFKKIGGLLLAGLLIQGSWFMIGALVDISTIATIQLGAFPSIFISGDTNTQITMKEAYAKYPMVYHVDLGKCEGGECMREVNRNETGYPEPVFDTENDEKTKIYNDIFLPNNNTMAGPLLYIGNSILNGLHISDYSQMRLNCESISLKIIMNMAVILLYMLAMILLAVINIVRLGLLWFLVALGPLLFLVWGLKWGKAIEDIPEGMDKFGFSNFIKLIFVPVRIVLFLGLILLFLNAVWSMVTGDLPYQSIPGDSTHPEVLHIDGVANVKIAGDLYDQKMIGRGQTTLGHLIVVLFTLFALRILIKASFSNATGFAFIDDALKGTFDKIGALVTKAPIVPVGGGQSIHGLKKLAKAGESKLLQGIFDDPNIRTVDDIDSKGRDKFQKWFGEDVLGMKASLGQEEINKLRDASGSKDTLNDYIEVAKDIRGTKDYQESMNFHGHFGSHLENLFEKNNNKSWFEENGLRYDSSYKNAKKGELLKLVLKNEHNADVIHNMITKGNIMKQTVGSGHTNIIANEYRKAGTNQEKKQVDVAK